MADLPGGPTYSAICRLLNRVCVICLSFGAIFVSLDKKKWRKLTGKASYLLFSRI